MGGVQVGKGGECSVNGGDGERLLKALTTHDILYGYSLTFFTFEKPLHAVVSQINKTMDTRLA